MIDVRDKDPRPDAESLAIIAGRPGSILPAGAGGIAGAGPPVDTPPPPLPIAVTATWGLF